MDYPRNIAVPSHINSMTRWMSGNVGHSTASVGIPATFAWTANVAVFIPLFLPWPYRAMRAFFAHGSVTTGNSDIGIYTSSGALIWSSGSTAGTANTIQYVTISPDLLLAPGRYFMAWANDGTTNRANGSLTITDTGRLMGLYQQAAAFPLPTAATFAAYAGTGFPLIGITNTPTGF